MDAGSTSTFHAIDYILFGLILAISAGVGVFYAIKDRNNADTEEVFLGGRKMSVIPVTLSLLASFQSAVSIIGVPAEVYFNNTMYLMLILSIPFSIIGCNYIFIPIFYNLKITSIFEYLSLRFHVSLRTATSILYSIQMLLYMAIVLYAPSLALSAVTGLSLWPIVIAVGVVCTFYTTIGGLKAVVWADTFQILVFFAGLLAILIQGSIVTGGLANAWNISSNHGRIKLDETSGDPTVRHSIWNLAIGGTVTNIAIYGTNQAQVQRACACPTLTKARHTISSGLNALAAVTLQDIVRPHMAPRMSETGATWIARGLAIGYGVVCLALTYVVSLMGSVIQGAFAGLISSLGLGVWILIGAKLTATPLTLLSVNSTFANMTTLSPAVTTAWAASHSTPSNPLIPLYRLSYQYYTLFAVIVSISVGLLVSALTCFKQPRPPGADLIFPYRSLIKPCLPRNRRLRKKEDHQHEAVSELDIAMLDVDDFSTN
ncbi:sodium-dependent multivitamin transporter-like isoform X2 [Liolophura sinensis]|uniref:sodium-dependent multivitamin transporter-like isoform X2 n=1 Tax=Liolophura sinensis TaxID=3198878 RepID=UPI0031596EB6